MTPKQIVDEINWIKDDNIIIKNILASDADRNTKAECRARLHENNHQLMHLESTLISIKCDPNF